MLQPFTELQEISRRSPDVSLCVLIVLKDVFPAWHWLQSALCRQESVCLHESWVGGRGVMGQLSWGGLVTGGERNFLP